METAHRHWAGETHATSGTRTKGHGVPCSRSALLQPSGLQISKIASVCGPTQSARKTQQQQQQQQDAQSSAFSLKQVCYWPKTKATRYGGRTSYCWSRFALVLASFLLRLVLPKGYRRAVMHSGAPGILATQRNITVCGTTRERLSVCVRIGQMKLMAA